MRLREVFLKDLNVGAFNERTCFGGGKMSVVTMDTVETILRYLRLKNYKIKVK